MSVCHVGEVVRHTSSAKTNLQYRVWGCSSDCPNCVRGWKVRELFQTLCAQMEGGGRHSFSSYYHVCTYVDRSFVVGNSIGELARFDLRKGGHDVTIVTCAVMDLRVDLPVA